MTWNIENLDEEGASFPSKTLAMAREALTGIDSVENPQRMDTRRKEMVGR